MTSAPQTSRALPAAGGWQSDPNRRGRAVAVRVRRLGLRLGELVDKLEKAHAQVNCRCSRRSRRRAVLQGRVLDRPEWRHRRAAQREHHGAAAVRRGATRSSRRRAPAARWPTGARAQEGARSTSAPTGNSRAPASTNQPTWKANYKPPQQQRLALPPHPPPPPNPTPPPPPPPSPSSHTRKPLTNAPPTPNPAHNPHAPSHPHQHTPTPSTHQHPFTPL